MRSAIELGVDRIQHGVRAVEDPRVLELLAERGTCLDVCPTSNVVLDVYPSLEEHPLPRLLEAGVRCSLGADDPLLFGSRLADQYVAARDVHGLGAAELGDLARASFTASRAPQEVREAAERGISAWVAQQS